MPYFADGIYLLIMSSSTTSTTTTLAHDKVPTIRLSMASPDGAQFTPAGASTSADVGTGDIHPPVSAPGTVNTDALGTTAPVACKVCNREIKREKKVICTGCGTSYHPGCASLIKVLANGALQRCCGQKVDGVKLDGRLSPNTVVTLSGDDRSQLFNELKSTVREEIKNEVLGAMKEALGEELKAELLSALTNVVGAAVSKAFEGVNKKVLDDINVLKTSVEVLQEAKDLSDSQVLGLSEDLGTISTRLDSVDRTASNRYDKVMEEIAALRVELAARATNPGEGPAEHAAPEAFLDEIEDRLSRRRNVIMFGVPEPGGGDAAARKSKDLDTVTGIMAALSVTDSMRAVSCLRLGKFSENLQRPRPLKVVFTSCDVASKLIVIASQKRSRREIPEALGQVSILPDRTESQRLRYKQLKLELARRRAEEGNPSLKILTRNGIPRIVSQAPRANRGPQV